MAKIKSVFLCGQCGNESSRWLGKCPECGAWNSYGEESSVIAKKSGQTVSKNEPLPLSKIVSEKNPRIKTNIAEVDRVLSGGIVKGALALIAGDPGIGKSTLLLQICQNIGSQGYKVLYVSGEESTAQIKMRAERLGITTENLYILAETNVECVENAVKAEQPDFLIIDSIQTMHTDNAPSAPGSVTQVRESAAQLMRIGKGLNIAVLIVGHATKDGAIAGPKILEHMVDTVLYFEGDRYLAYRILRAVKNRFGSVNEIGVFEMRETGLREIAEPSKYMLSGRSINMPGSVVTPVMEGARAIVTEVQALASTTSFSMPKRSATGHDYNRLMLLVAVMEKRLGLKLATYDIYVNIAGGVKASETAVDAAVISAVLSSYRNKPIDQSLAVFGEAGLTGELRAVSGCEKRITEAQKLGFKTCVIPSNNLKALKDSGFKYDINIIGASNVSELLETVIHSGGR